MKGRNTNFIMRINKLKKQSWEYAAERLGLPLSRYVEIAVDNASFTVNGVTFNDKTQKKGKE